MSQENATERAIAAAWEAQGVDGRSALKAVFHHKIIRSNMSLNPWELTSIVIERWYNKDWKLLTLVDDLKVIVSEDEDHFDNDLLKLQRTHAIVQNILKHLTDFVSMCDVSWEEVSPRVNWIFLLSMSNKGNEMRCKLLAIACGEHLPLLTDEEEQEILPLDLAGNFRQWYALGVLEQKKQAHLALKLVRKTKNIVASKSEKESAHTVEDIGDVVLNLMQLPSSNGHANDMIVKLMERIGGMPGGGEELERIEREAPNYRKTQPE